jgi:hypothetical protein
VSDVAPTVDGCDSTNPALIPLTSHVIAGRYGTKSPLDPAGGLAGKTAQNRQTLPHIAAGALPRSYPAAATGDMALAACSRRATSASRSVTWRCFGSSVRARSKAAVASAGCPAAGSRGKA